MDKHQDEERFQDVEEFQAIEEDKNLVEVAPRIIGPLPQLHFSNTPMLSSVLKAQRTPKPSVKRTVDNLQPFQPRHSLSPRHRRSHTPQTPTQAFLISRTYRKPLDHSLRWQSTSTSKQRFRAPQYPNQTLPISEDSECSLNTLGGDNFGRKVYRHRLFQFRPTSSPREVASPSSFTLVQSPVKFGTAAQTFSFDFRYGAATEFKASQQLPGPHRVDKRVMSHYNDPSNEVVLYEPTAERTYFSVNLGQGPRAHKRRRNT